MLALSYNSMNYDNGYITLNVHASVMLHSCLHHATTPRNSKTAALHRVVLLISRYPCGRFYRKGRVVHPSPPHTPMVLEPFRDSSTTVYYNCWLVKYKMYKAMITLNPQYLNHLVNSSEFNFPPHAALVDTIVWLNFVCSSDVQRLVGAGGRFLNNYLIGCPQPPHPWLSRCTHAHNWMPIAILRYGGCPGPPTPSVLPRPPSCTPLDVCIIYPFT